MALRRTEGGRLRVSDALDLVAGRADAEEVDFREIHIRLLANGDVAYRMFPPDGGDYEGGVILGESLDFQDA